MNAVSCIPSDGPYTRDLVVLIHAVIALNFRVSNPVHDKKNIRQLHQRENVQIAGKGFPPGIIQVE